MDLFRALYVAIGYVIVFFLMLLVAYFILFAAIQLGKILIPGFWGGVVGLFGLAIIVFFIIGIVGSLRGNSPN
jgi:hypothetical protein